MTLHLRRATDADLPAIAVADGRAFGMQYSPADLEDFRPLFEPDRFLLAEETVAGPTIGITGSFPFDLTLPGGARLSAPGISWVGVATTHRRRGVLRSLLAEQHRAFAAEGVAVSLLTASESGIYGRFGYGAATVNRMVEIDRRLVGFRPDAPDPGGVRLAEVDEARPHAADVHRRWCAVTPGAVSRSGAWWDWVLLDREHQRGGGSALFHLLHADGYAAYRWDPDRTCRVRDLFAVTDDAHAALWRVLLGLDLVRAVAVRSVPLDDPLPHLLTDPREVRTTALQDGLWARVLDVPTALAARTYAVEVDVVLEVADAFLGRGGRFRLRGGPDGAACEATTVGPGAHTDIAVLGALLLGGHRAHSFARAGLLGAADPGVLHRMDTAFRADQDPQYGTNF